MPTVVGWWLVGLVAASASTPRVSVQGGPPDFAAHLAEELGEAAILTQTASAAEVQVSLDPEGRHLAVHDSAGRLLAERGVSAYDAAARRAFVAVVAQVVQRLPERRSADAVLPAPPPVIPPPDPAPPAPPPPALLAPPPPPPPPPPLPGAPTATATAAPGGLRLTAEAGLRLFGAPRAARASLDVGVGGAWGPWRATLRIGGAAGPTLNTAQLTATAGGLHALAEGGRVLLAGEGVDLEVHVGAGASLTLGRASAREPPFADPGAPQDLRLWTPVVTPALVARWRTPGPEVTLRAAAEVALLTYQVTLPPRLGVATTAPLETPRWSPWVAVGVAWGL